MGTYDPLFLVIQRVKEENYSSTPKIELNSSPFLLDHTPDNITTQREGEFGGQVVKKDRYLRSLIFGHTESERELKLRGKIGKWEASIFKSLTGEASIFNPKNHFTNGRL